MISTIESVARPPRLAIMHAKSSLLCQELMFQRKGLASNLLKLPQLQYPSIWTFYPFAQAITPTDWTWKAKFELHKPCRQSIMPYLPVQTLTSPDISVAFYTNPDAG